MKLFVATIGAIAGLVLKSQAGLADVGPLVQIEQGVLRGTPQGSTVSFKGIPYAAPPTGERRWAPPGAPRSWQGIRSAQSYGSECMQTLYFNPFLPVVGKEDCLTLNVWAPTRAAAALPVMVFFHGGAYIWGSGAGQLGGIALYDGTALSQRGPVVVVTVNFRLGPFGFLVHPALASRGGDESGNYGMLDQIAALRWVQKNISAFGGDPSRVTVFGESAGAYSVLSLMTSPLAEGLFSRAIMESVPYMPLGHDEAQAFGEEFAAAAGCLSRDPIACLRDAGPMKIMVTAVNLMKTRILNGKGERMFFSPNVDGRLLPDFPINRLRSGNYHHIPFLIGTNADEMRPLFPAFTLNPILSEAGYTTLIGDQFGTQSVDRIKAFYPYPGSKKALETLIALLGDSIFQCSTRRIAKAATLAQTEPVGRYLFSHVFHSYPLKLVKAGHGFEIPFVFHNFFPWSAPDAAEKELSETMMGYWLRFAIDGNPNSGQAPVWPMYNTAEDKFIEFDSSIRQGAALRASYCDMWDDIDREKAKF